MVVRESVIFTDRRAQRVSETIKPELSRSICERFLTKIMTRVNFFQLVDGWGSALDDGAVSRATTLLVTAARGKTVRTGRIVGRASTP